MNRIYKSGIHIFIIVLLTILAIWNSSALLDNKHVESDALNYLRMAYNIYKNKTFSLDKTRNSNPEPTIYREPGYPAFLALSMAINPRVKKFNINKLQAATRPMINLWYDLTSENIEKTAITVEITFKLIGKGKCNVLYQDRTKDGWKSSNKMVDNSGEWLTVKNVGFAREGINASYAGLAFWPERFDTRVRIKNVKIISDKRGDSRVLVQDRCDVWKGSQTLEATDIASSGGMLRFGGQDGRFEISPGKEKEENYYEVQLTDAEKSERREESIKKLKSSQIAILVIISFLTGYFIYIITKKIVFSYISFLMVITSITLTSAVNELLAELFTALLVLCVSILLYKTLDQNKIIHFVLLGVACGYLALTRAIFVYFIIILLSLFIYLFYKKSFISRKNFLIGSTSFFLVYSLIIGSWMIRNYIHFRDTTITLRGGVVLSIRANYNMMSKKEFWGSFLYWAPESPIRDKLFNRFYGKNKILERFYRDNPASYYRSPDAEWRNLLTEYSEFKNGPQRAERELRKGAVNKILAHPFRHIMATFPFAWRGHFVESGHRLKVPFNIQIRSILVVNILYFISLLFVAFISLKKINWPLFAFCLPALYCFAAYSFMTHNEPRFNTPLIPILVSTFLISFHLITTYRKSLKPTDDDTYNITGINQ